MHTQPAEPIKPALGATRLTSATYNRILSKLSSYVLLVFALLFVSDWFGLRFNTTPSVDLGFYWVVDKLPEKGDLVSFCPKQEELSVMAYQRCYFDFGNCPGHYERLLKHVVGITGDKVNFTAQGITVNGELLPFSKPLFRDGLNRLLNPLINKTIVLGKDEFLVMTNRSPLSFDSRYFGPINLAQVSDVVVPLWTLR